MDYTLGVMVAGAATSAISLIRKAREVRRLGLGRWLDRASDFEIGGVVLFLLLLFASCAAIWVAAAGK